MKDLNGKKLLILAGADVHVKIVKAAKALGVYTIVTDYLELDESPAKVVADEYWMLNIMDINAIVQKCQEEKVDGVLAFCIDPAQIPYQQVCEKLGVPCYGTKEQFKIMTDKRLFKDYCWKHGVDAIPEYTWEDIENGNVHYPVLVKPTISRGSRGQTVCYTKDEIRKAISIAEKESRDGHYLIERYMQGCQDMSLSYIVIDSEPYLVKIGDRYLGTMEDNLDRQHMLTILPSIRTKEIQQNIEPNIRSMIKSLGVKFGSVFFQGFYENGRLYMYDPGLRFPGSDFDIVTQAITGFDAMSTFVHFALTGDIRSCFGDPREAYNYNGGACILLSLSVREGTIAKFEGFDEIAQMPNVFSSCMRRHVGGIVEATGDVRQRAAEFCAYVDKHDAAKAFVQKVYNTLHILDEKGDDMIISKVKL